MKQMAARSWNEETVINDSRQILNGFNEPLIKFLYFLNKKIAIFLLVLIEREEVDKSNTHFIALRETHYLQTWLRSSLKFITYLTRKTTELIYWQFVTEMQKQKCGSRLFPKSSLEFRLARHILGFEYNTIAL